MVPVQTRWTLRVVGMLRVWDIHCGMASRQDLKTEVCGSLQGMMDVTAGNCEVLSNAYMGALRLVEQLQECSWDEHILRCQVHGIMWSKVQPGPQESITC